MGQKEAKKLKPGDVVWSKQFLVKVTVTGVEPSGRVIYGTVGEDHKPRSFMNGEVQKHDPRRTA